MTSAGVALWPGSSAWRRCWPCRPRPRQASWPDLGQRPSTANTELARSKDAVQARYDLAVTAIQTFHTGVSEDFLLKEETSRSCGPAAEVGLGLLRQAGTSLGQKRIRPRGGHCCRRTTRWPS